MVITSSTRNRVGGNTPRGFESHLLRHVAANPWGSPFSFENGFTVRIAAPFSQKALLFGMLCLAGLQAFANPHLLCRNLPCFALNLSISCYRTVYSPSHLSLRFCLNNRDENKYLLLSNSRCVRVSFESASY